uniref:Uncharacterized protein n=1 Tax=Haemonchus contortus TaxID=6289 RepID=A0A7I4YYU0_HAECO
MRFLIPFCIVIAEVKSTCLLGNSTSFTRMPILKHTICVTRISFYGHSCVEKPKVYYGAVEDEENLHTTTTMEPQCAFSNTAAACICRGTDCNDIKNTKEVLAKYLATTDSAEIRNFILCFLAKGDKKSFATATKMKVDAPKRKVRDKKKKRVKRSKGSKRRESPRNVISPIRAAQKTQKNSTQKEPMEHLSTHSSGINAVKHHQHKHSSRVQHRHRHHNTTPMVIGFGLLVLVILCAFIVSVVFMVISNRKPDEKAQTMSMAENVNEPEDPIPEQFEQSVQEYSRSLHQSHLDPGLR